MSTRTELSDHFTPLPPDTSEAIAHWLKDLKADRAERTITRYISVLQRFTLWYEQETCYPLAIRDLNPIVLVGYRNALQQTEQPSTVNIHIAALRSWGKWLKRCGLVAEDPCERLKSVKRQFVACTPRADPKPGECPAARNANQSLSHSGLRYGPDVGADRNADWRMCRLTLGGYYL